MASVQAHRPECPLCRAPFDPSMQLTLNHQLRDLVSLANNLQIDCQTREAGWEAFPTARTTAQQYSSELGRKPANGGQAMPSAPPVDASHLTGGVDDGGVDVMSLEPPCWVPDSQGIQCSNCCLNFRTLVRLRHHCRLCGRIFCNQCCSKRMLLPPKFAAREPARVCEMCSSVLGPLQPYLTERHSRASQDLVHDVTDSTAVRSWVNNPLTRSLEQDIYKATNILREVQTAKRLFNNLIPDDVLQGAAGFALLSQVKVGLGLWSARVGTGLVVAHQPSGGWSAPCAVSCCGAGWGPQAGGEILDIVLVLPTKEAVDAFSGRAQLTLGGSVSVAVGVGVGRIAEAFLKVGDGGGTTRCYSYAISRGAFVGISVEGAVISTRDAVNMNFYGRPVTAKDLLVQEQPALPVAAAALYDSLEALVGISGKICEAPPQASAPEAPLRASQLAESVDRTVAQRNPSAGSQRTDPLADHLALLASLDVNGSFGFSGLSRSDNVARVPVTTAEAGPRNVRHVEHVEYVEEEDDDPLPMLACP
ncbi:unnamed protein product [Ostreobium quekettii]|uniref:FYVE-type domain-containing protein n=1 Tax=Ostreobium quekettii TaxID=121088 RepID=A0A8S1JGR5_9CHLO|nr:unnamed protein product [Ostreobium quekettii]